MDDFDDRLSPEEFAEALAARYERLSILTLDLAEEAGEAAVNFSLVDRANKPGHFDRRIAAMSRAIWAHRVIERLRLGKPPADSAGRIKSGREAHNEPHNEHDNEQCADAKPSEPDVSFPLRMPMAIVASAMMGDGLAPMGGPQGGAPSPLLDCIDGGLDGGLEDALEADFEAELMAEPESGEGEATPAPLQEEAAFEEEPSLKAEAGDDPRPTPKSPTPISPTPKGLTAISFESRSVATGGAASQSGREGLSVGASSSPPAPSFRGGTKAPP